MSENTTQDKVFEKPRTSAKTWTKNALGFTQGFIWLQALKAVITITMNTIRLKRICACSFSFTLMGSIIVIRVLEIGFVDRKYFHTQLCIHDAKIVYYLCDR